MPLAATRSSCGGGEPNSEREPAAAAEEMPGKGQRRREKNYRAAHGGDTRLPPPPKQRELDALPSKLRRLIAFQNKQNGSAKADADAVASSGGNPGRQGDDGAGKNTARKDKKSKKQTSEPPADAKAAKIKGEDGSVVDESLTADLLGKRKRGKAMDLRFKELDENVLDSKKQKRKKHLDEKKKKKRKGSKPETLLDFPGHDKVKFGEIVDAPPKLSFPKVKSPLDVSHEWLRKEAIDNYRNIKGWTSRPGLQLPTLAEKTSL